jgi:hypothetical protein
MKTGVAVACVDVGSIVKHHLGWAVIEGAGATHGRDPADVVGTSSSILNRGLQLAIGFECPLYVPVRDNPLELTCCRKGERYVNWCGGPGGAVLSTGLVQAHWILTRIARAAPGIRGTTRWSEFASGNCQLLAGEAFVTSKDGRRPDLKRFRIGRMGGHEHDALTGAATFVERLDSGAAVESDLESEPSMSLIAWHLLSCSLSADRSLLTEPCIVIKARKRRVTKARKPR